MIYTEMCESIEGERIALQTRKLTMHLPRHNKEKNCKEYPFKLGINSLAEIVEAYPKERKSDKPKSARSLGDGLRATVIDGYALKIIGRPTIEKGSASHKGQFLTVKGGSYAHVEIGTRELLARDDRKLTTE